MLRNIAMRAGIAYGGNSVEDMAESLALTQHLEMDFLLTGRRGELVAAHNTDDFVGSCGRHTHEIKDPLVLRNPKGGRAPRLHEAINRIPAGGSLFVDLKNTAYPVHRDRALDAAELALPWARDGASIVVMSYVWTHEDARRFPAIAMKQNGPLSEAAAIQMVEDTASVGAQFICIEIDNLYETVIERCRATGVEIVLPVWAGFEGLRERLTDLMHKGVRNIISPYPQNIEQLTNRHAAFSSSTV